MGELADAVKQKLEGKTVEKPEGKAEDDEHAEQEKFSKEMAGYRREIVKTGLVKETFMPGGGQSTGTSTNQGGGQTPGSKVEEKYGLDISAMFKAQSDMVTSLLTQIATMGQGKKSDDPFMTYMLSELKEMKAKQEGGQVDPLTMMTESAKKFDEMAEGMKKRLGLGAMTNLGGNDMTALMKLEEMKEDREEKARHWQDERDEKLRRWQQEDAKWKAEFELKAAEFEDRKKTKESATGALGDLLGALAEGIEPGGQKPIAANAGGGSPAGAADGTGQPAVPPAQFKCSNPKCPAMVNYPEPGVVETKCEGCGQVYEIAPKNAAPAPSKGFEDARV